MGVAYLKEMFLRLIRSAERNEAGRFTEEEHENYMICLDRMLVEVMDLSIREVNEVFRFIENSMRFYLTLCAKQSRPQKTYEGCMENLLFLVEYLLQYNLMKVKKIHLLKLYDIALHIERFQPKDPAELIEYEIKTGLLEKIHFYIDYYFGG